MAKKLEDILNESDTPVGSGAAPTEVINESGDADASAVADKSEVDAVIDTEADATSVAVVGGVEGTETAQEPATAESNEVAESTPDAMEDADEVTEIGTCDVSEARIIHPRRRVTLYRDAACTKPIGTYSGTIRVLFPSAKKASLAEYTVISAGKRITKRAYVHV